MGARSRRKRVPPSPTNVKTGRVNVDRVFRLLRFFFLDHVQHQLIVLLIPLIN